MSPPSSADGERVQAARARLLAAGQGRLLRHADALRPDAAAAFLLGAAAYPWEQLVAAAKAGGARAQLRPPVVLTLRRQQAVGGLRARLARAGRVLLTEGKVAALLLAGGQASRLAIAGAKGGLVLGPTPDRTLFAVLIERVGARLADAGRPVPLVVCTSPDTDGATRAAFAAGARSGWGLAPGQLVAFVPQGTLPVLDEQGEALLEAPGRLVLAPDGHGGALLAVSAAGTLDDLLARGVRVLVTFQVDNPLARPLDPVLLGWLLERGAQALGKAVRKASPEERVGVYARDLDGRTHIVEYSELQRVVGGEALVLGSTAVHAFDLAWLAGLLRTAPGALPLHAARKRVPFLDETGVRREPEAPNAIKLERFLFDVLPHARRAEVLEVDRAREFAPIKSAQGADSPATARALVAAEVRRWHRARGLAEPAEPALRPLEMDGDGSEDDAPAASQG